MRRDLEKLLTCSFGDSKAFLSMLEASGYFSENDFFILRDGDDLASALCVKRYPFADSTVNYIFYAATAPEKRSRGFMKRLILTTLEALKGQGSVGAVLIPASDSLYNYYESIGFKTAFYISRREYSCYDNYAVLPYVTPDIDALYEEYTSKYAHDGNVFKTKAQFTRLFCEYTFDDSVNVENNRYGCGFLTINDDGVIVRDYVGDNEKAFAMSVSAKYKRKVTVEALQSENPQRNGMIYFYGEEKTTSYINNMLN